MHPLRRTLSCGPSANGLPQRRRHSLRPLRSSRDQAHVFVCPSGGTRAHYVALRRRSAGGRLRFSGRRLHADAAQPRIFQRLHQRRRPEPHRIVQGARPLRLRDHGASLRLEEVGDSFCGQRRRSARRLLRRCRSRSAHLHAERCPHGQPHRVRLLRRARHPGRRPDQRLRPQSRGTEGIRVLEKRRMVRRQHHQRALSRRRQENHGLRSRRTTGLENAAGHHLSHGRRRRPARHVEGLRRNGSSGLDRLRASEDDHRASRGLRADRESMGAKGGQLPKCGRTPRPWLQACASQSPTAIT